MFLGAVPSRQLTQVDVDVAHLLKYSLRIPDAICHMLPITYDVDVIRTRNDVTAPRRGSLDLVKRWLLGQTEESWHHPVLPHPLAGPHASGLHHQRQMGNHPGCLAASR